MSDPDRPDLGLYIYEEIEAALHEVDRSYWQELRDMQTFAFSNTGVLPRGSVTALRFEKFLRDQKPPILKV